MKAEAEAVVGLVEVEVGTSCAGIIWQGRTSLRGGGGGRI